MRNFAQPSEVAEPIELLRAGMLFHARGLLNTKAIQNNLDWIWPYWVEKQFNPADDSFIPRAFSFSHINLTHRNWTAVGLPGVAWYPIVDPRGLVTSLYDGWSLDFWFMPDQGPLLAPSKSGQCQQALTLTDNLTVTSTVTWPAARLLTTVRLCLTGGEPHCCVSVQAPVGVGSVVVVLRPYNPEGVSFVNRIAVGEDRRRWLINNLHSVEFDYAPSRHVLSVYKEGDVAHRLQETAHVSEAVCDVGLGTAAAIFPAGSLRKKPLELRIPIYDELQPDRRPACLAVPGWREAMAPLAKLRVGDQRTQWLFDLAASTLVLLTPEDAYPGPYTYKRFWFRDASLMLNALLTLGGVERTRRALSGFAPRQRRDGYFLSQEGEWDSNGEAIWIYHRFGMLTGEELPDTWLGAVKKGAEWIRRKRLPKDAKSPGAGLFPAGFSAEHLGPNDFYYWDDFWGVAGLRCAADLLAGTEPELAGEFESEADDFMMVIERSVPDGPHRRFPGAMPAAPTRRMDSGAIGSLVADYPLQFYPPGDLRMVKTADYLRDHSSHAGGFFQHMIHSGINAYLTLNLAQVRLRAGDPAAAWQLMDCVAGLASSTGQWPEAIHPRTGGGCMGDGQHAWAAAEWVLMIRHCFVREEGSDIVIAAGVRPEWWRDAPASLGPVLTPFGSVTVQVAASGAGVQVRVEGEWRGTPPHLLVRLPGFPAQEKIPLGTDTLFQLTSLG
ncbi:MAG TPA: hypothetical protein VIM71_15825 [Lacunisphaera sp.]